jgi:GT2 family glycosyltransferase
VLLLNPDTVVRPGAIVALADFLLAHPEAAIAGSRLEDPDGTPQRSAFHSITPGSELLTTARLGLIRCLVPSWEIAMPAREEPHRADWLAGAAMLIRRSVFESIGLLDEVYFLYFEEVDFCLRARRAGLDCWYVPRSRIVHLVGAATGVSGTPAAPKRRPAYWFQSRRHYFLKNWGRGGILLADLNWLAGMAVWRLRAFLQRRSIPDPPHFLRDFLSHSVFCRGFRE